MRGQALPPYDRGFRESADRHSTQVPGPGNCPSIHPQSARRLAHFAAPRYDELIFCRSSSSPRLPTAVASRISVAAILLISVGVTCGTTYWLYSAMQQVFRTGLD